jgi:DNA-binding LacI/PurR family transcriptional regulator
MPNPDRAGDQTSSKLGHGSSRVGPASGAGRCGAVALIVFEPHTLLLGDPFLPRLIGGVEATLHDRGLHSVLLTPRTAPDCDWTVKHVAGGHADAAMLVSFPGSHPLAGQLAARGIPVVFGGRPAEPGRFNHVDIDSVAGASHAVVHLAAGGRRAIATITGRGDVPAAQERLRGYRHGLDATALPADDGLVEVGDFTREGGARAMRFLLSKRPQLDAVFAASDLMAAGALQVLAEAGRRVPEDVAVVGYDDDPFAASLQPPLTSVRQPIERMGREMAAMVVNAINAPDRAARAVILATQLQVRLSSAPAGGAGSSAGPQRGGPAG